MYQRLASLLPALLPKAIAWAEQQQQRVLTLGRPLDVPAQALARSVGVLRPECIRIEVVEALPLPEDPDLRAATIEADLLGPGTIGLTLGYAVLLHRGFESHARLLSHEFRHVHQCEQLGSIGEFLPVYLEQIIRFGYEDAPLEVDARAHERDH